MSGCNSDKSVVSSYKKMKILQNKENLTVHAEHKIDNKTFKCISYHKKEKWRSEYKTDDALIIFIYDGKNLMSFKEPGTTGVFQIAPDKLIENDRKWLQYKNSSKLANINLRNPLNPLFNWLEGASIVTRIPREYEKPYFTGEIKEFSNIECDMIRFSGEREACLNKDFGITLYQRLYFKERDTYKKSIITVSKIETKEISDEIFLPPSGVKHVNLSTITK